jgi:hypothetical protein
MKRWISGFALALVIACGVALTSGVSVAHAASCSPSSIGGEKAPLILDSTTLTENGSGGYICTVKWAALSNLQYEFNGTWHNTCSIPVQCDFEHPTNQDSGGTFLANSVHNWTEGQQQISGPDKTPACSVNWRWFETLVNANATTIATDASPTLAKTC